MELGLTEADRKLDVVGGIVSREAVIVGEVEVGGVGGDIATLRTLPKK